jgi:hypothetical protein
MKNRHQQPSTYPITVDDLPIAWPTLIHSPQRMSPDAHPYLQSIRDYTNLDLEEIDENIPGIGGMFLLGWQLNVDPAWEQLVALSHWRAPLSTSLVVPYLLTKTNLLPSLAVFDPQAESLYDKLSAANFQYVSPFRVEGLMAETLYNYGMYTTFFQEHSANEAMDLAQQFTTDMLGDQLEDWLVFETQYAWGAWFDRHSCSDRTILLLSQQNQAGYLLCFSHSD